MESLDGSSWDVVIAGTGLHESLLALALSRSGKKILHVDKNGYYGGPSATFNLQDAETWAKREPNADSSSTSNATVQTSTTGSDGCGKDVPQLAHSRAYSLTLSPDLIYARSALLSTLVSAKVDSQLEFLAMGSWWTAQKNEKDERREERQLSDRIKLTRVPNGREDLFTSEELDLKSRRALIRFLRFVGNFEEQKNIWSTNEAQPFSEFLESQFNLYGVAQQPIHAISMSQYAPEETQTGFALPRIAKHLRSMGVFGQGFGVVVPKWGGMAEIAQVGCRAGAVGGGVYVLGQGVTKCDQMPAEVEIGEAGKGHALQLELGGRDNLSASWLVCGPDNNSMPSVPLHHSQDRDDTMLVYRSISILSSPLSYLLPPLGDLSPSPVGAVIVIPSELTEADLSGTNGAMSNPVHIILHSSDTGECPPGQCVLYASVALQSQGYEVLDQAVNLLLQSAAEDSRVEVLWRLRYQQPIHSDERIRSIPRSPSLERPQARIIVFPESSTDPVFDDSMLSAVKQAWSDILGSEAKGFLDFPERGDEAMDD